MIPPSGFKSELYPLRHKIKYSGGLTIGSETNNTMLMTIVRHTNDIIAGVPGSVVVNPHNTGYVEDAGPTVCKMSIIDKLSMSLKINMTENCGVDSIDAVKLLWRPIFFSFGEKLDATDDDTGTSVETILGLTKDATFEDIVPLSTNKLPIVGQSDLSIPLSSVNIAEIYQDYNYTGSVGLEDHTWDENLFQDASRRYTNKGALKACVGRTRHLTLSTNKRYQNYYIDKFVPRALRRIVKYSYFGIQVHIPLDSEVEQHYLATDASATLAHIGVKMIVNFHEWNADHYQEMSGTPP